jgi:hypothetical protein
LDNLWRCSRNCTWRLATSHHAGVVVTQGEDDGSAIMPAASYLDDRDGEKPLGVYAVYDSERNLQYVGYSRNIVLAVRVSHAAEQHSRDGFSRSLATVLV